MSLRFNWKVFVFVKLCIVFASLIASFAVGRIGVGTEEDKREDTEYDEIKITNEKALKRKYDNHLAMSKSSIVSSNWIPHQYYLSLVVLLPTPSFSP